MRLFILLVLGLFTQESVAQVRQFSSIELKGIQTVFLETESNGTERLVGFWKDQRTPLISGGVTVFEILHNQLLKVWEDGNTFSFMKDWDSADLNRDNKLDFAIAGSGLLNNGYGSFIALYLSNGTNQYQKHTFPQKIEVGHIALGDIDGDRQPEIVFSDRYNSNSEYDDENYIGEGCPWPEFEIKIARWRNDHLFVQGTGIRLEPSDQWMQLELGDINNDNIDELVLHQFDDYSTPEDTKDTVLGRSVLIYDLSNGTTLIHQIPHLSHENAHIKVNKIGEILEFKENSVTPSILSPNGGLSKLAVLEIPEVNLGEWAPIQIDRELVLSKPAIGKGNSRQLTIYKGGE